MTDKLPAANITPPWITGYLETPVGKVPQVEPALSTKDLLGSWKARWGINRMNYRISPGLYAVGCPDAQSPVLVTANYKMSFDLLRKNLPGYHAWIMVLDTNGINVWCASGKGTFGTREIIERINSVHLTQLISHRTIILPQLGASGTAAHEIAKSTGFKVVYGPIRAQDIPAFLQSGMKANEQMREVRFTLTDRLVLIPIELVNSIKYLALIFSFLIGLALINPGSVNLWAAVTSALVTFIPILGAALMGIILVPILLPWIPGRAFSWKGWLLGLIWAVFVTMSGLIPENPPNWVITASYFLILPALSSFLALNFTGSTPYTSLSGVKKEMKIAVPVIISSAGLGIIFMIVHKIMEFSR